LTPATTRGGTFVRPGAFAWGRPSGDDHDPSLIEEALAAAARDPDRIDDLLDTLRQARLWLPLPDGDKPVTDGSAVHLPTVTYLGDDFVPAFTSADRLTCWTGEQTARHIVVPATGLARLLPRDLGIALNPDGQPSVPIYPDGVRHLAGDVGIGQPTADPAALLASVGTALRGLPAVRHASRAWLRLPGRGEGLVISVVLRDPADPAAHEAVLAAVELAARNVPRPFPLDVTFPGEAEPHPLDDWIAAHATPFYTSP
ncbi:MAG TPA: enhanced serine sensitivity protein SseB C-terminal domain-containing protein, partial [Streptosporangiaceae bacterium]|nr:enhanced serine sensitivity protein SseB C-terminal domain-containing protein [Streptosporangiaceae bacterium]